MESRWLQRTLCEDKLMEEIIAVVENGQIRLPPDLRLPDGLKVKVIWGEELELKTVPYDREMLTEEDVKADLQWATGKRFHP